MAIMDKTYNIWNKWDKLETVVLGSTYDNNFYRDIKSDALRDCFLRISDEVHEDLENYEKVLKDFGCEVLRPQIDPNDNIMNYIDENGRIDSRTTSGWVPRPPLFPRDTYFVGGSKIFRVGNEANTLIDDVITSYNSKDIVDIRLDKNLSPRGPYPECNIHAPQYTVVGKDLYVDTRDYKLLDWQKAEIVNNMKGVRLNYLYHGGHSDGCFHTIAPGAIISLKDIHTYKNTFPNWEVLYLSNQGKFNIMVDAFKGIKYDEMGLNGPAGKWWVPGEENNDEFTLFVESWLQNWVGYIQETVFDVNVLMLDRHHCCVNNVNNKEINEFLKKHKIEPIHIPWRHRYFFDGGLHCLTLDLKRDTKMENYFPKRPNAGVIDYPIQPGDWY
jgi:hypothetical protein